MAFLSKFSTQPPTGSGLSQKALSALQLLAHNSPEIEAAALVSHDGLIVASVMDDSVDVDRFGAMCASLLALAHRAASEVKRGELRQIILDGVLGPMLLTQAGQSGVVAVAALSDAKLGKLILDTRKTAKQIAQML